MPSALHVALQRFRSRVRRGEFAAGTARATTLLAIAGAALLVVLRIGDRSVPEWFGPTVAVGAALLVGVAIGWLRAARLRVSDTQLVEHLEQRLRTGGLLLVAAEGVALPDPFAARLAAHLRQVHAVLPRVDVQVLAAKPLLALLLLVAASLLPAPAPAVGGGAAAAAAVARLDARVEALVADPRVPEDVRGELQTAVRDLARRSDAGEHELWREIDQLQERLDREVAGLAAGEAAGPGGGAGSGPDAGGDAAASRRAGGATPLQRRAAQLAEAARLLQQSGDWAQASEGLSAAARNALAAARDESGGVDGARLAADPAFTPELAEQLAAALATELSAVASIADAPAEAAAAAARLAEQLAQSVPEAAPSPSAASADQTAAMSLSPELLQSLMQSVAQGASELAGLAEAFDGMTGRLQDLLGESAPQLAELAAGSVDLASLLEALPEDPQQLQALAERLGELARSAAGAASPAERAAGATAGGEPGANAGNAANAAQRERLQQLAERLAAAAETGRAAAGVGAAGAGASGSPPGSVAASPPAGAGVAGGGDQQTGSGGVGRGPGHAALRMTERASGEASGELELPAAIDPERLAREWLPVEVRKAEPEIGSPRAPTAGGSTGREDRTGGAATWQLRLMPRHRQVVQRFFDDGPSGGAEPSPNAGVGQRGNDDK